MIFKKYMYNYLNNEFYLKIKSNDLIYFLLILFLFFTQSCAQTENSEIRLPAIELYQKALVSSENKFFQESLQSYEKLVNEYPGTRLGILSHLMMGDLYYKQNKWLESENSYRDYLLHNPRSNLTPYVLNKLIALNYERNHYGLFIKSRDYDRNMEPNRTIIREYQRFYLLFPHSPYLSEVKTYYKRAMSDLAEHELHVANFYFDIGAFHSAINRYLYLLKNYPNFTRRDQIAKKLIKAYISNQQPERAAKMQEILDSLRERNLMAKITNRE